MKNFNFLIAILGLVNFLTFNAGAQLNSDFINANNSNQLKMSVLTAGDIAFHDNLTQATFSDTVKQGEIYYFEVVVQNFSQAPMDSCFIKYYLGDDANNFELRTIKSLEPGEAYTLPVLMIETDAIFGSQQLNLELNPNAEKPESDYDNNRISVPFFVIPTLISSTDFSSIIQSEIYNYPNPVNSATSFHVELGDDFSQTESININIFDLKGQMVKSINVNNNNGQGKFSESWNAADESANALSAGVYFYNVIAEDNSGKMHSIRANSNIQILR